jgi:transcriptional regulator GlxA family with amidase domain
MFRDRSAPALFGIVLYPTVEPIDLGATFGVLSMARRLLPGVKAVTLATTPGDILLANNLRVGIDHTPETAPPLDVVIVTGGAGWPEAASDPAMLSFLRSQPAPILASVCTGALILQAAGLLDGLQATTRRTALGAEPHAPLARLPHGIEAATVDHGPIVTGGGVTLATDTTLHLLARLYGQQAAEEVARAIEYDRAWAANRAALGVVASVVTTSSTATRAAA